MWNYKSVPFSLLPLVCICLWVFKVLQASLMAWMVKNLPVLQETEVRSLGREDPLEKGMATHSSILAWRIPWPEKPGGLQSIGLQSQTWSGAFHFYLKYSTFCYLYSGQPGGTEATIRDRHHCNWAVLTGWCYGVLETVNFSYLCFLLFADLHISYTERKSHSFEVRIYVLFFLGHSVPGNT